MHRIVFEAGVVVGKRTVAANVLQSEHRPEVEVAAREPVVDAAGTVEQLTAGRDNTVDKPADRRGHIQHTADSIADTVADTIVL